MIDACRRQSIRQHRIGFLRPQQKHFVRRFHMRHHGRRHIFGRIRRRNQITVNAVAFQSFFRSISDHRKMYILKITDVFPHGFQFIKETLHAVGAGQYNPCITVNVRHGPVKLRRVHGFRPNETKRNGLGTLFLQQWRQAVHHGAASRHQHPFSGQRFAAVPLQLTGQTDHIAYHGNGRGLYAFPLHHLHNGIQGSHRHLLSRGGSLLQNARRRLRVLTVFYEILYDVRQIFKPHKEDKRSLFLGQRAVVQYCGSVFVTALMAGDHMERRSIIPVSHRNPAVSRNGIGGRYARHHHKFHARGAQFLSFLATSPENVWVAAL